MAYEVRHRQTGKLLYRCEGDRLAAILAWATIGLGSHAFTLDGELVELTDEEVTKMYDYTGLMLPNVQTPEADQ